MIEIYPVMLPQQWDIYQTPVAMTTEYILNISRCHNDEIYQIHTPMVSFNLKCYSGIILYRYIYRIKDIYI